MASSRLHRVKASLNDALARLHPKRPDDPPPSEKRFGHAAGKWPGHPMDNLPEGCPVTPLGKDGDDSYFVDTLGQLRSVNVNKWGKKILLDLFADVPNFVTWAWPRFGKSGDINGVEVDHACACLLKAAAERGIFDPANKVRGRGAWTVAQTGELVWHSGDKLWQADGRRLKVYEPGEIDELFYPRRPPVLMPWREFVPVTHEDAPGPILLAAFRYWNWERPEVDPILLLGWIGASILGGALPWRPAAFATGDRSTGKSTLHGILKAVLGDALIDAAETTPAGIYQRVRQDTLPVAVDELEADADNRKARGVINLARLAASGGLMLRGGAEHKGQEFRARNCFFFSAINPPPLGAQDRSRMALLQLRKLDKAAQTPTIEGAIDTFGRIILRQLMEAWPDFAKTFGQWKDALRGGGLDGRAQDTYGVLLACAQLLIGDEAMEAAGLPVAEAGQLGAVIAAATAAERAEQTDNWRACLEHLLNSPTDAWSGGEKPTVGRILEDLESGHRMDRSEKDLDRDTDENARRRLNAAGLGLKKGASLNPPQEGWLLAVPPASPLLSKMFTGTVWGGGVWMHALKQAPADVVRRDLGNAAVVKINRVATRCVLVDLRAFDAVAKREGDDVGTDGVAAVGEPDRG